MNGRVMDWNLDAKRPLDRLLRAGRVSAHRRGPRGLEQAWKGLRVFPSANDSQSVRSHVHFLFFILYY